MNFSKLNGLVAWYPMTIGSGTTLKDYKGSNDGTISSYPQWKKEKTGQYSLDFDGTDDRVTFNDLGISSNDVRSFCFWFKLGSTTQSDWTNVVGWLGTSASNKYFDIEINDNDELVLHKCGTDWEIETLANLGTSDWHHVAVTYDGTDVIVYLDSVEEVNEAAGTVDTNGNFNIGYRSSDGKYDGQIANVLVFDRALTANEIKALYKQTYIE